MSRDVARRVYQRLLWLAPRDLRRRHHHEMEAVFLDALVAARPHGMRRTARVWCHAVADLAQSRLRARAARRRTRVPPSTSRQASMISSDVRYALRSLARQRGASALVIVMLALGIAANVAVFSLVNGLFLKPFPFPDAGRLVYINEAAPKWNLEYVGVNYPDFHQWRQAQRRFERIALYNDASYNLSDGRGAERVLGAQVTYDFAAVLGVRPILGRMFTAEDDRPNAPPVVVLGERLWRDRFGADPGVLGRSIRLQSTAHTIVGVVPAITEVADGARLWTPMRGDPNQPYQSYGATGMGRLKPGATIDAANRDLLRAQEPIWRARDQSRVVSPFVRDLRAELTRDFSTATLALGVAVALLLAVACANVASVMLARAIARRREMGIRLAIGSSRLRLVRQLFVENLVLAVLGGAIGVLLGQWTIRALLAAVPDEVPRWTKFGLDARAVAFALAASLATAVLFGWAPALHAFRGDLRSAVHAATNSSTTSPGGRRTLRLLVGAECALAALLLVCGGLLFRAYERVRSVDAGFRTQDVVTFNILLPEATYPDSPKRLALWDRLATHMSQLPGVSSVGLITCPPLGCHWGQFFDIEGRGAPASGDTDPVVLNRFANAAYFRAMGIRLVRGRVFEERDGRDGKAYPAIVNETFARTFWPGVSDPIGRRFRGRGSNEAPWLTVVGVVADIKHYGPERPMRPGIYRPLPEYASDSLTVVLHTKLTPESIVGQAQSVVRELDPELPVYRAQTMEQALARSLRVRSLYSWMLAVFAGLTLALALGGTYGVSTYLVTQRRREMAIRVALGAGASDIFRSVMASSLGVVALGVLAGVATSLVAARQLSSLLFDVKPMDPMVVSGAIVLLVSTALAANYRPARRAASVDPMSSLRAE